MLVIWVLLVSLIINSFRFGEIYNSTGYENDGSVLFFCALSVSRVHKVPILRVVVAFLGDVRKIDNAEYLGSVHGFGSVGCVFGFPSGFAEICCCEVILVEFSMISGFYGKYVQLTLTFLLGFF